MRSWITVLPLMLLPLMLFLVSADARAQPSEDARMAFEKGKQLYTAGDLNGALIELERAVELSQSPNARLLVGRCLKELGRKAEAFEVLRRTARDAAELAQHDPKYEQTRDAAASLLSAIEPDIGSVVVVLPPSLAGAVVRLGERTLDASQLGSPVAVEPGLVVATAELDGRVRAQKSDHVEGGATITVLLMPAVAGAQAGGSPGASAKPVPGPTRPTSGGEVRIAGFVVGSLGLVGLTSFAVAGALVLESRSTLDDECGGHCPDDSHADLISEGRTLQTVANASLGVGAALLSAGVFMVAFGGPTDVAPATTGHVSLSPNGALVVFPIW